MNIETLDDMKQLMGKTVYWHIWKRADNSVYIKHGRVVSVKVVGAEWNDIFVVVSVNKEIESISCSRVSLTEADSRIASLKHKQCVLEEELKFLGERMVDVERSLKER